MLAKISLTAAFFLMVAPPIACASNHEVARLAPITHNANQSHIVLAQDSQQNVGTSDNDNDNDSTDSDDDKQDSDDNQADQQQNADGTDQQVPPTVLGGPDSDQGDQPQAPQNVYPVDPSQ